MPKIIKKDLWPYADFSWKQLRKPFFSVWCLWILLTCCLLSALLPYKIVYSSLTEIHRKLGQPECFVVITNQTVRVDDGSQACIFWKIPTEGLLQFILTKWYPKEVLQKCPIPMASITRWSSSLTSLDALFVQYSGVVCPLAVWAHDTRDEIITWE